MIAMSRDDSTGHYQTALVGQRIRRKFEQYPAINRLNETRSLRSEVYVLRVRSRHMKLIHLKWFTLFEITLFRERRRRNLFGEPVCSSRTSFETFKSDFQKDFKSETLELKVKLIKKQVN